ncbi:MAG: tetratricopeptide repeat protein, partial [Acidobacteriota bacterium]
FDPHFDYAPPEPFASRFADRPYDGEVANVDSALGELLQGLSAGGLLEDTLVAVTADHGESLGEHGERSHGIFIYESTMRVPLILAWPAGLPRGRTVEGLVRLLDLPATLLDLAGLAPLPRSQGQSLAGAIAAGRAEALEALLESWLPRLNYGWSELTAVQDSRWKYIRAPRSELYDLSRDPSETENRIAQQPAVAETYRKRLEDALREAGNSRSGSGPASLALDAETERLLRSLGYLGDYGHEPPGRAGGPAAGGNGNRVLPDPKEKIDEFLPISEALLLVAAGRLHEALRRLQAAERSNPSSVFIKRQMGNAYRQLGRLSQAQEKLRSAVQLNPNNPGALVDLAGVLLERGPDRARLDEAQSLLREALRQNPHLASAHHLLGLVEQARGEPQGAIAAYRAALELAPTRLTTLRNLAVLLEEQGALEEALALYVRGTELDPSDSRMHTSAAWILFRQGRLEEAAGLLQRAAHAAPSSPAPLLALAQVREAAGELDAALRALRTGARRESPPGKAHVTLARFLLRRADPCAASTTLEDVASAAGSPDAAEARKLLARARHLCAQADSGAAHPPR